jgi:hypothetical protein
MNSTGGKSIFDKVDRESDSCAASVTNISKNGPSDTRPLKM